MIQPQSSLTSGAPAAGKSSRADPRWTPADLLRGARTSVWRLERVKAIAARQAARGRADGAESDRPRTGTGLLLGLNFVATALIAFVVFQIYVLVYCFRTGEQALPAGAKRIVAVHGEWSTRSRHVLSLLPTAKPPVDAIVLLGRQSRRPEDIRAIWTPHVPELQSMPILSALSLRAAWASLGDIPALLREGLREIRGIGHPLGLREEIAIAFRVYLGAAQARWWQEHAPGHPVEVLFASTGTADTTLLEKAIQHAGGRTVHLVHGQAIGPNFAGFSDLALFKSAFDARAYDDLRCYGKCAIQDAERPKPRRGSQTVLIATNLAHPMNDGFRRHGLRDEINLLHLVRRAADLMSLQDTQLLWKPHPVTFELAPELVADLRATARRLGIRELPRDALLSEAAQTARWIVSSPSTVAIELLEAGQLSIVMDPQQTVGATALSAFPGLASLNPEALAELMAQLDDPASHDALFHEVYASIGPARPLELVERLA